MEKSEDLQLECEARGLEKNIFKQNWCESVSRRSVYINFHPCILMLSILMPCIMMCIAQFVSFFFH